MVQSLIPTQFGDDFRLSGVKKTEVKRTDRNRRNRQRLYKSLTVRRKCFKVSIVSMRRNIWKLTKSVIKHPTVL